jgi:hypothetical protein
VSGSAGERVAVVTASARHWSCPSPDSLSSAFGCAPALGRELYVGQVLTLACLSDKLLKNVENQAFNAYFQ